MTNKKKLKIILKDWAIFTIMIFLFDFIVTFIIFKDAIRIDWFLVTFGVSSISYLLASLFLKRK